MFGFITSKHLTLSKYLIKHLLLVFGIILIVLTIALSLDRFLRLVQVANGVSLNQFFLLLFYLLPHYLSLTIPASQFFATLIILRRLYDNSEFVVMLAAGISSREIITPIIWFSVMLSIVMLIITGLVQPYARYAYREARYNMVNSYLFNNISPRVFHEVTDSLTIRTEEIDIKNNTMQKFFAVVKSENNEKRIIIAETATLQKNPTTNSISLLLKKGILIKGEKQLVTVRFDRYLWDVSFFNNSDPYRSRGRDEREMTFDELVAEHTKSEQTNNTTPSRMAELHARLVQSASIPLLTLLALPLALIGIGRTGKAFGVALGVVIFILYEKTLALTEVFAASGAAPAWLILWAPFCILALLAWILNLQKYV